MCVMPPGVEPLEFLLNWSVGEKQIFHIRNKHIRPALTMLGEPSLS